MISDNPEVLQLRRHSIKEMDSKLKPDPLRQSFEFLSLTPDIDVIQRKYCHSLSHCHCYYYSASDSHFYFYSYSDSYHYHYHYCCYCCNYYHYFYC